MNNHTGILLEGGAMRSVFSAGVLDFFLDKNIQIDNILAISAGAYAGMNYASGQRGRVPDAIIHPLKEYKYLGLSTFLRKGTFFDMDYLFDEIPRTLSPYDYNNFQAFPGRFITSVINCLTGETQYYENFHDQEELFTICRAANSLPLIARITDIDGMPMLDGGMADAIPIEKALKEGWKKIIVVFTRDSSYRKKLKKDLYMKLIHIIYRKYPNFLKRIEDRAQRYNDAIEKVIELEKQGRAFILRPTKMTVGNNESNVDKLMQYYNHGYETAGEKCEELIRFLES